MTEKECEAAYNALSKISIRLANDIATSLTLSRFI